MSDGSAHQWDVWVESSGTGYLSGILEFSLGNEIESERKDGRNEGGGMTVSNSLWFKYMTCALPCWIMGCPLSLSIQLSFHALRQVSMPFRRCLLKLSYHLPELPKVSFDMCCLSLSLSLSLSPPHPCLLLHFIAFGNSLFSPTSSSLTHSSLQSLSASHPPLCLSPSSWFPKAPEASVIHWLTFLCYF